MKISITETPCGLRETYEINSGLIGSKSIDLPTSKAKRFIKLHRDWIKMQQELDRLFCEPPTSGSSRRSVGAKPETHRT